MTVEEKSWMVEGLNALQSDLERYGNEMTAEYAAVSERYANSQKEIHRLTEENSRLRQWVSDCQSGMYINCVYCGHRYGPRKDTPVAMADVLKEHIEQCPEHPLSHAKHEIEKLEKSLSKAKESNCFLASDVSDLKRERNDAIGEVAQHQAEIEQLRADAEYQKKRRIMRQSQVYHAMKLVDRVNGDSTCDDTFFADVDRAIKRVNKLGPSNDVAEEVDGE
jgi:FtsZ-binding cell division protein ZapB